MAHHSEEVRLGGGGRLRRVLRDREFGGPRRYLLLQSGDLGGDPLVPDPDPDHHRLEARHEVAQFSVRLDIGRAGVVAGFPDGIGEGGQFGDRLADATRHAQGDQEAGQQGDARSRQADQHSAQDPGLQARRFTEQGDFTDTLALAHDRGRNLQRAAVQDGPDRVAAVIGELCVGAEAHTAAGLGQKAAVHAGYPGVGDVRHLTDGPDRDEHAGPLPAANGLRRKGAYDTGGLGEAVRLQRRLTPGVDPPGKHRRHNTGCRKGNQNKANQLPTDGRPGGRFRRREHGNAGLWRSASS